MDTDDKVTGRLAYVGADLHVLGTTWAKCLIDNAGIAEGDKVWLPVEAAGAAYGVLETEAIASSSTPLASPMRSSRPATTRRPRRRT